MWVWGTLAREGKGVDIVWDWFNYLMVSDLPDPSFGPREKISVGNKDVEFTEFGGQKYCLVYISPEQGEFISPSMPPPPKVPGDPMATVAHGANVVSKKGFLEMLDNLTQETIDAGIKPNEG